jgi:hypothetical protein
VRRFDDLWRYHVEKLLEPSDSGFEAGQWVVQEIERRKLRDTANKLFAHYAADKSDLPLSYEKVAALLQSNGWVTGQEVLEWAGQAMWKIGAVWIGLRAKYSLPGSEPKEWMLEAMDGTQWVVDQIAERYGPPRSAS